MVWWVVRLAALVLLALGIGLPALVASAGSPDPTYEETTIRSYVAEFDVSDNGDLAVTETLRVNFPSPGKHGIFRFWDLADPNDAHARRIPRDFTVTRDGAAEPFDWSSENGRRYRVAKIGSPDSTVTPGEHMYVLRYRIDGVLIAGTGDQPTEFYWNLIPGGWRQSIDRADLTVRLPVPAQDFECGVGVGLDTGCTARGAGTTTLHVTAGPLAPFTPLTIKTGLDLETPPAGDSVPWGYRLDGILGPSPIGALALLGVALAGGVAGLLLSRTTREPKPSYPLQYAPPDGIGPAQAKYIFTEKVDREAFVATIMQAAEKGAVTLDRGAAGWSVTDRDGAAGWAGVDAVTSGVAGLLSGPQTTFVANPKDVAAGQRLKSELGKFTASTSEWARANGLIAPAGIGSPGGLLVVAAGGLAVWMLFSTPFDVGLLALVPGLFAIGALELLARGASTKRTATGRALWSRIGGFHRILSTPSSVQRFEFSGRQELYTAYLPWAVALGCAAEWAAKYRTEMGAEPPVPAYFGAGYVGGPMGGVTQMVDDFSSTLDSAISSYEATQRSSSSSGGGGFSGGGGGGGGGGGSW